MLTRAQIVYAWMVGIFVTCLLVANLTGSMLFSFDLPGGGSALLSAGIIPFPVTFLLTDLMNEFYGKKGAQIVTLVGFGMSILTFILLAVGERLPVDARSSIPLAHFLEFSGQYSQMFIASLSAYLIGQFLDIYIFGLFRRFTHHRLLWLRATGSTVISQLFDSLIVTSVAFYATYPASTILHIAASNYVWKFLIAVAITPLLYLGHAVLRRLLNAPEPQPVVVSEA